MVCCCLSIRIVPPSASARMNSKAFGGSGVIVRIQDLRSSSVLCISRDGLRGSGLVAFGDSEYRELYQRSCSTGNLSSQQVRIRTVLTSSRFETPLIGLPFP